MHHLGAAGRASRPCWDFEDWIVSYDHAPAPSAATSWPVPAAGLTVRSMVSSRAVLLCLLARLSGWPGDIAASMLSLALAVTADSRHTAGGLCTVCKGQEMSCDGSAQSIIQSWLHSGGCGRLEQDGGMTELLGLVGWWGGAGLCHCATGPLAS